MLNETERLALVAVSTSGRRGLDVTSVVPPLQSVLNSLRERGLLKKSLIRPEYMRLTNAGRAELRRASDNNAIR
jgi:hypothetical protein